MDHLRGWIGREEIATDHVAAELAGRFRATFDEAPGAPCPGDPAPALLHWCLALPGALTRTLGPDGHPARGGFLPPVALPRRMWAGGSLAFHNILRIGDAMRRTSRIADVSVKAGRSGTLCFVTVQHEIDVAGRPILSERQDIVYRNLDAGGAPSKAPEPAAEGWHRREVLAVPPLLFRYSALTFNGHRIHYDHPYATQVESYPGLVVHGPLQATLPLRFAAEIHGVPPRRFTFRGLSPLFDNAPFFLNAEADGATLKLWTACARGPVALSAEAQW
ncbi:MaoC family dehydratase N-terminal domain-containing protein [Xanthobacter dioxanivorans]|uniref:MaoC family dehydratase N-terminal domain-containing protein n=1 Tax=Xanthobacter dioxanivorans TaxID=2528964 RepID=A0A974PUD2_9HYPH|nr:MaoC family dehydratase N-terminal domain-containing protein [Xanthobacter dioxanivorans]QRG09606.1 MaoC family dehydratase N-terminal domain-containing protein [Xanthobacter dioxanivorans]